MEEKIKELNFENFIWVVYFFIAIFAIISNEFEKKYYKDNNKKDQLKYKNINVTIFIVALLIYLYFIYRNIKHINDNKYAFLGLYASILFFIAGSIYLYIEYSSLEEAEIGLI